MNPKISVIIPNYNYSEFIIQCIESVLNQDYPNIEIVVVDDGSTDNSLDVLEQFRDKIKIISTENFGAPTARNFGLMNASGELIAYLDADDYWLPNKLSLQFDLLSKSGFGLAFTSMKVINEERNHESLMEISDVTDFRNKFLEKPTSTPFPPSTVLMTRELVSRVGLWDTTLKSPAEDFDYFRRCAKFTKFIGVAEPLVVHREHSRSLTARSIESYYLDNRLALIKLFADEYPNLSFSKRRVAWFKLHIAFGKTFLKKRRYSKTVQLLLRCIFPINL